MEDRTQRLAARNNDVEKRLNESLSSAKHDRSSSPTSPVTSIAQLAAILKEFRSSSEELILRAQSFARSTDVETRLWTAHSRVNNRFRKQLLKLREENAGKHVEIRQFIRQYLEFLKDGERFYRELVKKLNSRFGPIYELNQMVQYRQNILRVESPPEIRHQCLLSCHQTLIYLGDLSRYRTTEKLDKDPTWAPAVGYYSLAALIRPSSGFAYNQQSIIALEEADHFRATYYLYRAIAVEEPHPKAIDNLEIAVKKARKAWETGDLRPRSNPQDRDGPRKALLAWFIRLHSLCFLGQEFSGHHQLETEVISHFIAEVKGQSPDGVLSKIALINLAAQHTAASRFQEMPEKTEIMRAFFFFLRLNLNTFIALLKTWSAQISENVGESSFQGDDGDVGKKLNNAAKHTLPVLRIYSAWLLTNSKFLNPSIGDEDMKVLIARFWTVYAECLTQTGKIFPIQSLSSVPYLLDEDADTIGFKPVESDVSKQLLTDPVSKQLKAKPIESDRLSADHEMLARVKDLLIGGLLLVVDPVAPVEYDGITATFKVLSTTEVQAQSSPVRGPQSQTAPASSSDLATLPSGHTPHGLEHPTSTMDDEDGDLSRMVDDLVGPEEDVPQHRSSAAGLGPLAPAFQPGRSPSMSQAPRLHSVSSLWDDTQPVSRSSPVDNGMRPHRTPPSVTARARQMHSRMGSANSLSSQSPLQNSGMPSSFVPTPPVAARPQYVSTEANTSFNGGYTSGMHSPLLFGAGDSVWSTVRPRQSVTGYTPPNGQGG